MTDEISIPKLEYIFNFIIAFDYRFKFYIFHQASNITINLQPLVSSRLISENDPVSCVNIFKKSLQLSLSIAD